MAMFHGRCDRQPMKADDNSERRRFWTHFWCGLVVGGGWGAFLSWGRFAGLWGFLVATSGVAVVFALCAGRWGSGFWTFIFDLWTALI